MILYEIFRRFSAFSPQKKPKFSASNVPFESGDPSGQRVVPTSGGGRVVNHGLYHGVALHTILGRLTHFDEGQPVTFPAVADDLVGVPDRLGRWERCGI